MKKINVSTGKVSGGWKRKRIYVESDMQEMWCPPQGQVVGRGVQKCKGNAKFWVDACWRMHLSQQYQFPVIDFPHKTMVKEEDLSAIEIYGKGNKVKNEKPL